jgi:predicted TIM-barrel fold metal-dependent hydrolase
MATTTSPLPPPTGPHSAIPFIDTDVHEFIGHPERLAPYMSNPLYAHWVKLWTGSPTTGRLHPLVRAVDPTRLGSETAAQVPGFADFDILKSVYLDRYPVSEALLTGILYPGVNKWQPQFMAAVASAINDLVIEEWLARDPRLRGSIQIAPTDPAASAREIERLADHPQMAQVMLPLVDYPYGNERFHPIFEAAERHGLPIAMHQTGTMNTNSGFEYFIEWHAAHPLSFQSVLINMIFHGVFDRFPGTRLIMLEGGFTWVPSLMLRLDHHYRSMGEAEVPWVTRLPSRIIREQCRFATQPMEDLNAKQLLALIDLMDSDELLCFATDFPHWDTDEPASTLPAGIPDDLAHKILFGNADAFYRFAR